MRITSFIIFNQLTQSLSKTLQNYFAQNQTLASGKRFNAPSDDPAGLSRAMDCQVSITSNNQYRRNIDFAQNSLNFTNSILTSYSGTLSNVISLVSKNSTVQDPSVRAADSQKAASLRDILNDFANSNINDQYLFAGFKTDTLPYAAGTYAYQGDAGVIKIPVDQGALLPVNVTGIEAFSYAQAAPLSLRTTNGNIVHYTPGAGTDINVVINDATDTTQLDTFTFSNVMQMTTLLSAAIGAGNTTRVQALADPFQKMIQQLNVVSTDVSSRVSNFNTRSTLLDQNTNNLQSALSSIQDADPIQTAAQLKQTEVTLQALRDSASRVLSQTLFDFLK